MARDPIAAAHKIIQEYDLKLPMNPPTIAYRLGIEVVHHPLSNQTSGCLVPEPQAKGPPRYLIIVNSRAPKEERGFTVAHTLGHWVLHRFLHSTFICDQCMKGQLGIEANEFAKELLAGLSKIRKRGEESVG